MILQIGIEFNENALKSTVLRKSHIALQLTAMEARWKTARESEGKSRPAVSRQQVMRDGKEKREEKRKIPLCARSEVVKIKYPRTCPIHICADVIYGA
jgi:hypothetical protein